MIILKSRIKLQQEQEEIRERLIDNQYDLHELLCEAIEDEAFEDDGFKRMVERIHNEWHELQEKMGIVRAKLDGIYDKNRKPYVLNRAPCPKCGLWKTLGKSGLEGICNCPEYQKNSDSA